MMLDVSLSFSMRSPNSLLCFPLLLACLFATDTGIDLTCRAVIVSRHFVLVLVRILHLGKPDDLCFSLVELLSVRALPHIDSTQSFQIQYIHRHVYSLIVTRAMSGD